MDAQRPRRATSWSLSRLIARSGIPGTERCSHQLVDSWRRGTQPTANYLSALSAALGVTMEELFEERPDDLYAFVCRAVEASSGGRQ